MTTFKRYTGTEWETIGLPLVNSGPASTLAYAQKTSNQTITAAGTLQDIVGLSVTVTVPEGRRLKITAAGGLFNATAGTNQTGSINIMEGATRLGLYAPGNFEANGTFGDSAHGIAEAIVSPTAGTHTYKVMGAFSVGTTNLFLAGADFPAFILVEDITGSTLPYSPVSIPVGSLGFAQRFANQTGIGTTPTLIGGLSVNVVVPAGRQLKITGFLPTFTKTSGAPTWVRAYVRRDGTDIQRTIESATNDVFTALTAEVIDSPTAGAHVYEILVDTDTGTVALDLGSIGTGANAFIIVEDITPTPTAATGAPGSTLGYAETPTSQAGITTEIDMTGLSVNVNVPAGRRLRITGYVGSWSAAVANDRAILSIKEGATLLNRVISAETDTSPGNTSAGTTVMAIVTPTAGSHTYKLTAAQADAGAMTATAAATFPNFILVEDITGAIWPEGSPVSSGLFASEAWTPFVPTLNQGGAVTATTPYASYIKYGRTVHCVYRLNVTGSGAAPNFVIVGLPVPTVNIDGVRGHGTIFDASTGTNYVGVWFGATTSTMVFQTDTSGGSAWGTVPNIAIASGDVINVFVTYEAAS